MSSDTLALLIDGDNASPKIVTGLLAEIANYGVVSVKRIYGAWTEPPQEKLTGDFYGKEIHRTALG